MKAGIGLPKVGLLYSELGKGQICKAEKLLFCWKETAFQDYLSS
jgi:hypothetical protein